MAAAQTDTEYGNADEIRDQDDIIEGSEAGGWQGKSLRMCRKKIRRRIRPCKVSPIKRRAGGSRPPFDRDPSSVDLPEVLYIRSDTHEIEVTRRRRRNGAANPHRAAHQDALAIRR
jgi:hypothetical protein